MSMSVSPVPHHDLEHRDGESATTNPRHGRIAFVLLFLLLSSARAGGPAWVGVASASGELGAGLLGGLLGYAIAEPLCADRHTSKDRGCDAIGKGIVYGATAGGVVGAGLGAVGGSVATKRRAGPAVLGGATVLALGATTIAVEALVNRGEVQGHGGLVIGLIALPIGCGVGSALGRDRAH